MTSENRLRPWTNIGSPYDPATAAILQERALNQLETSMDEGTDEERITFAKTSFLNAHELRGSGLPPEELRPINRYRRSAQDTLGSAGHLGINLAALLSLVEMGLATPSYFCNRKQYGTNRLLDPIWVPGDLDSLLNSPALLDALHTLPFSWSPLTDLPALFSQPWLLSRGWTASMVAELLDHEHCQGAKRRWYTADQVLMAEQSQAFALLKRRARHHADGDLPINADHLTEDLMYTFARFPAHLQDLPLPVLLQQALASLGQSYDQGAIRQVIALEESHPLLNQDAEARIIVHFLRTQTKDRYIPSLGSRLHEVWTWGRRGRHRQAPVRFVRKLFYRTLAQHRPELKTECLAQLREWDGGYLTLEDD